MKALGWALRLLGALTLISAGAMLGPSGLALAAVVAYYLAKETPA